MWGVIIPTSLVGMGRWEASRPARGDPSLSAVSLFRRDDWRSPLGRECQGLGTGHHTSCSECAGPGGRAPGPLGTQGAQNAFPSGDKTSALTSAQVENASNSAVKYQVSAPPPTHPQPTLSSVPGRLKLVQLRVWLWTREALQELASAGQTCRREPHFCNSTCQLWGSRHGGFPSETFSF